MKEQIIAKNAPTVIGPYSQAIRVADLLFCSGQVPLSPTTGKLLEGSISEQTRQVMENLKAVLETAGLSLDKIVKTTIFLKDFGDFAAVNEAYAQFFQPPYPARSTVEVSRLPRDAQIEIEAIAHY
jgi:2-iminobutanoate/2-iminopropanoate deaminase